MNRLMIVAALAAAAACTSKSDTTAPSFSAIAGAYTLATVNGHTLPAPATLPLVGAATVTGGSGMIAANGSINVAINGTYGSPPTSATLTEVGVVVSNGAGYTFSFSDGTSATATCTSSSCSVVYDSNTFVFTKG